MSRYRYGLDVLTNKQWYKNSQTIEIFIFHSNQAIVSLLNFLLTDVNQTYRYVNKGLDCIMSSVPLTLLMFRYVRTAWTPSSCHPGGFWDGSCEDYAEGLIEEYVHYEALKEDQKLCQVG